MKKEEAAQQVEKWFETFAKMFEVAKVSGKQLQLMLKRCKREDVKSRYVFDVLKALKNIADSSFEKFAYARGLISEEKWEFYEMMEYSGHIEQIRLAESIKLFRAEWKLVPPFRKEAHVKKDTRKNAKKKS